MRRDAEVLSVFAAIISKLREAMAAEVPRIFEAVFECTLQMITKNFEVRLPKREVTMSPGKDEHLFLNWLHDRIVVATLLNSRG